LRRMKVSENTARLTTSSVVMFSGVLWKSISRSPAV
jgi:hypothetical protein